MSNLDDYEQTHANTVLRSINEIRNVIDENHKQFVEFRDSFKKNYVDTPNENTPNDHPYDSSTDVILFRICVYLSFIYVAISIFKTI
jgi:hypothetical protein